MNNMTPDVVPTTPVSAEICVRWNKFAAAKNRLASSLDTREDVLDRLARTANASVQQRVAENRTANSDTLEFLAGHKSGDVRSAVAQNENCLGSTVDTLASDTSCDVRFAIAANPRTNTTLLERLAGDENPYVQDRARRTQVRLQTETTFLRGQGRA